MRALCAACALALVVASPARGQTISVLPITDLRFGDLMTGIPTRVPPTDAARRAEVHVLANGRITIVIVLPATLAAPTSNTMPVTFAANDGLYQVGSGPVQSFDPRSPLNITVPSSSGLVRVWVGGTATPSTMQAPGDYNASIVAQVFRGGA